MSLLARFRCTVKGRVVDDNYCRYVCDQPCSEKRRMKMRKELS